jgi:hypothetical protein
VGLQQINMADVEYDVAIAVTNRALNIDLGNTLVGLAIDASYDDQMQPAPPASAGLRFTGTLTQLVDGNGNPIDLFTVYVGYLDPMNPVIFNLMFAGGGGASLVFNGKTISQGADPWTFQYQVHLKQTVVALASLPNSVSTQMQAAMATYPGSNFQVVQLGFDWSQPYQSEGPDLGPDNWLAQLALGNLLPAYMASLSPELNLGYFALCTDSDAPSTVATSFSIGISPYQSGNSSPLDTLLLLFMLGNRPAPSLFPYNLPFTWVDDVSINGAAAIRSGWIAASRNGRHTGHYQPDPHCRRQG